MNFDRCFVFKWEDPECLQVPVKQKIYSAVNETDLGIKLKTEEIHVQCGLLNMLPDKTSLSDHYCILWLVSAISLNNSTVPTFGIDFLVRSGIFYLAIFLHDKNLIERSRLILYLYHARFTMLDLVIQYNSDTIICLYWNTGKWYSLYTKPKSPPEPDTDWEG